MQAMLALAMGTALLGIDVGWQPIEEGGLEYIVQIDPETLARLKPGDELATGIRPVLRDVRRYRIVIGKGPLPRIALPERPASPSGSSEPRPAPVPLAAADSQRSILVPAERGTAPPPNAAVGVPIAPLSPVQPQPRVAAVPRPAPIAVPEAKPKSDSLPSQSSAGARAMQSFDAIPDAAIKAPPTTKPPAAAVPAQRNWQAPPGLAAPAPGSKPATPPATLKLGDPPTVAPTTPPKAESKPAPKVEPPAANLGDRYRDAERYPPADRYPPAGDPDRYRDFAPPATSQPKAPPVTSPPAKAPEDRSANNAMKLNGGVADKFKAQTNEFVGPLLPPQESEIAPPKLKSTPKPPSFDMGSNVDDSKLVQAPKNPPLLAPPALEIKTQPALPESKLMADTFGQKPASLVNDPSVRPVSVEPTTSTAPSLPASAAKPAAPVPAASTNSPESGSRPWLPLTLALFTLFASIGGNIFLGWVAHDARTRYGSLLRESRGLTA